MDSRIRLLRQLVAESLYVVDEQAVADAIVARARVRQAVADPALRGVVRPARVRSFRRTRSARSFRLTSHPAAAPARR